MRVLPASRVTSKVVSATSSTARLVHPGTVEGKLWASAWSRTRSCTARGKFASRPFRPGSARSSKPAARRCLGPPGASARPASAGGSRRLRRTGSAAAVARCRACSVASSLSPGRIEQRRGAPERCANAGERPPSHHGPPFRVDFLAMARRLRVPTSATTRSSPRLVPPAPRASGRAAPPLPVWQSLEAPDTQAAVPLVALHAYASRQAGSGSTVADADAGGRGLVHVGEDAPAPRRRAAPRRRPPPPRPRSARAASRGRGDDLEPQRAARAAAETRPTLGLDADARGAARGSRAGRRRPPPAPRGQARRGRAELEADERAARVRIGMGRALARKYGANRGLHPGATARPRRVARGSRLGGGRVAKPAQRAGRGEHDAHRVPGPARRGRRRARVPPGSAWKPGARQRRRPRYRGRPRAGPARRPRRRARRPPGRRRRPRPARRRVGPDIDDSRRAAARQRSSSSAFSTSVDQRRAATSKSSVPDASATSIAYSPVSRRRT